MDKRWFNDFTDLCINTLADASVYSFTLVDTERERERERERDRERERSI